MVPRVITNTLVGFIVGIAGGLIGLGGAELRLPYLIGSLRLSPHEAVRINLAVSLLTVAAAIPARLASLSTLSLSEHLPEVIAIASGAVVAAYLGVGWLKQLSTLALARLICALLLGLGAGLFVEAAIGMEVVGILPRDVAVRWVAGVGLGFIIGCVSSILGVAGGEVIIPTLVFGYGIPIKVAGSLSMVISLPTVVTGLARHVAAGLLRDRERMRSIILPMGFGAVVGAVVGGLAVNYAPATALKIALGLLLIWSAWKINANHAAV